MLFWPAKSGDNDVLANGNGNVVLLGITISMMIEYYELPSTLTPH